MGFGLEGGDYRGGDEGKDILRLMLQSGGRAQGEGNIVATRAGEDRGNRANEREESGPGGARGEWVMSKPLRASPRDRADTMPNG